MKFVSIVQPMHVLLTVLLVFGKSVLVFSARKNSLSPLGCIAADALSANDERGTLLEASDRSTPDQQANKYAMRAVETVVPQFDLPRSQNDEAVWVRAESYHKEESLLVPPPEPRRSSKQSKYDEVEVIDPK